jgi:hypothetical protein
MANFNSMSFNPDTNTLTVKDNGTTVHNFDLAANAVKLGVTRENGQLKLEAETGSLANFGTSRLELKIKYDASTTLPSIVFDDPQADVWADMNNTNHKIAPKDSFHALFIGSDDIRHNRTDRTGLQTLLLEEEILSLGIDSSNNMLVVRYHDAINPNV